LAKRCAGDRQDPTELNLRLTPPADGCFHPPVFLADENKSKNFEFSGGRIEKTADSEIESSDCKTVQQG
jgi:hypothetical protein